MHHAEAMDRGTSLQREHADWIVGYLRTHGPQTTREIIQALEQEGRPVQAHLIESITQISVCYVH